MSSTGFSRGAPARREVRRVRTKPAARTRATGRLAVLSARDAVNATERAIYGSGAVRSVSVAEGRAAAGRPACTLLARGRVESPPEGPPVGAPCVHHRVRFEQASLAGRTVFELVAGTVQEAVDHCLVARLVATRLGLPGACSLDPSVVDGLAPVRIPDGDVVRWVAAAGAREASPPSAPVDPALVAEAAREAFEAVAGRTGRPGGVLGTHRLDDADYVLLSAGASNREAVAVADALRSTGAAWGAVAVSLWRPFPARELARVLGRARGVVLVEPRTEVDEGRLAALVASALPAGELGRVYAADARRDGEVPDEVERALALLSDAAPPPETVEEPFAGLVVCAAPRGPWSEEVLLGFAALASAERPVAVAIPEAPVRGVSCVAVAGDGRTRAAGEPIDLLVVGHPAVLSGEMLDSVREKGAVLVHAAVDSPQRLWQALPGAHRERIARRELRLTWIDPSAWVGHDAGAHRLRLQGALLAEASSRGHLGAPEGADGAERIERIAAAAGWNEDAAVLAEGASARRAVEPSKEEAAEGPRPERAAEGEAPTMPAEPTAGATEKSRRAVRQFHRTGEGAHSAHDPLPGIPLWPAAMETLASPERAWEHYPLVLLDDAAAGDAGFVSFSSLVDRAVEAAGGEVDILDRHAARLARAAARALEERRGFVPLGDLVDETWDGFGRDLDVTEAGSDLLREEIARVGPRLPRAGRALGLGPRTLVDLLVEVLLRERRPRATRLVEEARAAARRLSDLLRVDAGHGAEGSSPDRLSETMGSAGDDYLDAAALSGRLPKHRGSKRIDPERRVRIEQVIRVLERFAGQAATAPELVIVEPGVLPVEEAPAGARVIRSGDALETAIGAFDGVAERMTEVFRALRTARLDLQGSYDPALHDAALARFAWSSATADEVLAMPPVVVLETGERVRDGQLEPFSRVLRSGRPVLVVVTERVAGAGAAGEGVRDALAASQALLGHLAVAHRDAFVLQAGLGRPTHLVEGLRRLASSPHPAAALVAEPWWDSPVPAWLQLTAASEGRTAPVFVHDPGAGETWAERFDLEGNPQAERRWPIHPVPYLDPDGAKAARESAFTSADATALDPTWRSHFRVIPPESWSAEQIELADYLEASEADRGRRVPFIWVVCEGGVLARAVTTREVALACLDRMRFWRILQELGGVRNEYARRASEAARREALDEAEASRAEREAAHAEELERTRSSAAGEAIERLVAVLMNLDADAVPVAAPPATLPPPAAAPAEPVPVEEAPPEPAEEEEISFEEPYIDTILCTTCNECTNLNPKLFKYNENKQAYIADAAAGTFEQLVKAAEKCPARCIHPGVPRSGDETATDDLVARANRFN